MAVNGLIRSPDGTLVAGPFRFGATGMEVRGQPSFDDWAAAGWLIQKAAGSVQWWVGDWLNYGEAKYGEMYSQALEVTGMDEGTLRDFKWVSSKFEMSRRHDTLTFKHHREVAPLPPEVADAILERAKREEMTTRQVRQLVQQTKAGICIKPVDDADPCCTADDLRTLAASRPGQFGTIYADPPWRYGNQGTRAATDNHYPTMTVDELVTLPVGDLAAPAAHLWLWTTNGFLFECPRLFSAWGFEFKSSYVWVKPQIGIGNYLRNSHEFLLLAVRGGLVGAATDVPSWGQFDRTNHSTKPERIRSEVVERVSPGPRLELFGRRMAPGWTVWGDQIERRLFDAAS